MVAPSYEKLFSTAVETFDESKILFSETKAKVVSLQGQNQWGASFDWMSLSISLGFVCLIEESLDSDLILVERIWQEEPIQLFSCAVLPFFYSTRSLFEWTEHIGGNKKQMFLSSPLEMIPTYHAAVLNFDQKIKSYRK